MQREESPTMETGLERITALSRRCEVPSDERSAGKPHATICGSRGRVTAPGDPVHVDATRWVVAEMTPFHGRSENGAQHIGNVVDGLGAYPARISSAT